MCLAEGYEYSKFSTKQVLQEQDLKSSRTTGYNLTFSIVMEEIWDDFTMGIDCLELLGYELV